MPLPDPQPGLVIRYAYLWRDEALAGREEAVKARPCAVVLATTRREGQTTVVVAPITHAPPRDPRAAIEIPTAVKERLGLDHERSWIVTSDLNAFVWPGPDLIPVTVRAPHRFDYGYLPGGLTRAVISAVAEGLRTKRVRRTDRDA